MTIIRDIVSDFSDEDEIELCADNNEEGADVEIGSSELHESKPNKYVGQCKHYGAGCEWHIRASLNVKCVSTVVSQDHTKLNSSFISNCIINLVYEDPSIPIKSIVKEIVSRFGYTVTYRKSWDAKQLAMSRIYGD
ncbi:hypothetical protein Lal_00024644 [Lupinus albus]|nr:hypothetical protein Lal_00024644 [Lupinus albus]